MRSDAVAMTILYPPFELTAFFRVVLSVCLFVCSPDRSFRVLISSTLQFLRS